MDVPKLFLRRKGDSKNALVALIDRTEWQRTPDRGVEKAPCLLKKS